uniref:Protein FAR1-RELATED SEQUENCE n=1 Tax=Oryza sativa subsp. japonica TaxID=39947 RepID=Q2QTQ0_ORYSJ|nr:transposon protein, putative, unclassified [Oryza sativa Japonica Group]
MASGGEDPGPSDVRSHVPALVADRSHLMQGNDVRLHDDVQRGGLQQLGGGDGGGDTGSESTRTDRPPCVDDAHMRMPTRNVMHIHGAHVPDEMVPKFGMEFKSYEMAYAFYNKYVEHAGFNVRKSRSRAAYREICCSKEGKNKYRGDETKRERRRGSARIGCRAYVRVRNVVIEGEVALTITYNQHCLDVPCFEMKGLNHLSGYLRRSRIAWETALHHVAFLQTYTPIEFEYAWKEFIDKFGLHDSTELRDLYDIRHRWVPAFFKEDYCGHMTSTQRSESFNRLVKSSFVDHQTALHRFARRILEVVLSRKEKEAAETRACQDVPNVKTAWPFAEQLSRVYTRAVFKVFENTLDESVHFRIEQYGVDQTQWIISHSKRSEKHDWCQRQFKVTADVVNGQFICECMQWEHTGLFCPHLLRAFVHVQVEKIPHTYVLRRYSREAKSDVNFDRRDRPIAGLDGVKLSNRTKVLSLDAQQLVKWGRRSSVAFERATSVMKGLRNQLEEIPADVHGLDADDGVSEHEVEVGDGARPSI